MLLSNLIHGLGNLTNNGGYRRFVASLDNVEVTQRAVLSGILSHCENSAYGKRFGVRRNWRAEEFSQKVPVIGYDTVSELVKRQMAGESCLLAHNVLRYQPTSGSTSERKWIPYSAGFLKELQAAIAPWLADAYQRHPGLRRGRHYWSLSWLPDDLRGRVETTDDTSLLPLVKRLIQRQVMAVPESVQRATTSEAAMFATVCWLASAQDLSLISVWSPTFALGILRRLRDLRQDVAEVLAQQDWGKRCSDLKQVQCPKNAVAASMLCRWDGSQPQLFFRDLWPNLCVLSTWTTGASAAYVPTLKEWLPHVIIEGKGLWATEGVVTIPFQNSFPLALTSHFLEFRCLSTGRILPAWHLESGQAIQPIMSTSSGLLRYELCDELIVTGYMKNCPTLEFRGRIDGIDFVGEKIDARAASQILQDIANADRNCKPMAIVGVQATPSPYYVLLTEGPKDSADFDLSVFFEKKLLSFHHYHLARDLQQLGAARVIVCHDVSIFLAALGRQRGMIDGDIKAELLVQCPSETMFIAAIKEFS